MLTLSRYLLHLYPAAHRMKFGEEMCEVLRERQNEIGKRGALARWISSGREIGGLLRGAAQEHVRTATGLYSWEEFPIRRIRMRTEFRFPKATPVLMTVILGAVVMAIEKARAIQMSVPPSHQQVGPIRSADFTVLPSFVLLLVLGCVVGAIAWAIAYALRRSGVQRLEELKAPGSRSPHK
jgi:hypothetical protein